MRFSTVVPRSEAAAVLLCALVPSVGLGAPDEWPAGPVPTIAPAAPPGSNTVPDGLAATLPRDYRDLIIQSELRKHPDFKRLDIEFSDPARVRVVDSDLGLPMKEMTAVVTSYGPVGKDGSPLLMIVIGVALFDHGALLKTIGRDSRSLEWPDGKPLPHADTAYGRLSEVNRRFEDVKRFHDPQTNAGERRRIRRDIWLQYEPAIELMKVSSDRAARLRELLEARKVAPLAARQTALDQGVDPFSGAMDQALQRAKAEAELQLDTFFGADQVAQLEFLSRALAVEVGIRRNEGLDLEDAGIPLSPEQLLQIAKFHVEVMSPDHNESFSKDYGIHEPVTGLSLLEVELLDRYAHVLASEQMAVVRQFYRDRHLYADVIAKGDGRSSGWILEDPAYGLMYRRYLRHQVLEQYLPAVKAMVLPPDTTAKLIELLVERDVAPREADFAAEKKGGDRAAMRLANMTATDQAEARLRALVGDQGYRELNHLKLLLRTESFVGRDEGAELALAGSPLTEAQLRAVSEAFLDTHTDLNPDYPTLKDQPADPASGLTPLDVAYLQRTEAILSAQQQQVVTTYRADQSAVLQRINSYQPRAAAKGADPAGAAPKL